MLMRKAWSRVAGLGCAALLISQVTLAADAPATGAPAHAAPATIVPAAPVTYGTSTPVDLSAACAPACPAPACPAPACPPCCPPPCVYSSIEGLFWWVKNSSVVPLVTTNPDPNRIAALNEPGTAVLFGGATNDIDVGNLTGIRGTIGVWSPDHIVGLEGSIFGLPDQGKIFTATAGGLNGPVIAVPFNSLVPFNFNPAGETSLNPGNTASQISVSYTTMLWGADVTGMANLLSDDSVRFVVIGGFKYLNLEEDLSVNQLFLDLLAPGTLTVRDSFSTRNQFFGAGLGARVGASFGIFSVDVGGKVSVGPNRQSMSTQGLSRTTGVAFGRAAGDVPAGLFAEPSNSGTYVRNTFTVVPEIQGRLTATLCCHMHLWVAYDYLYMNDVVRASSQIDRNLNATQNPVFQIPVGVPAPGPTFSRTTFWAQGVSAGLGLSY